jgi:phage-related protein
VIAQVATTLGDVLAAALTDLLPLFQELLPVFRDLAAQYLPQMVPLIKAFGDAFLAVLPILPPLVSLIADILVPALKVAAPVLGVYAKVLVVVAEAIGAVLGPVAQFVAWILRGVDSAKTWTSIGDFFVNIWHKITAAFDAGIKWIKEFPGKAWAALKQLPEVLERGATEAFHRFFYAVGYGIGTVVKEISKLPDRVNGLISSMWDWITNAFSTGVSSVIGFAKQVPAAISHLFRQAADWAASTMSSLVSQAVGFLQTLPGKAWDAIKGLPGLLKSVLSDAGSWLYNAGKDVITGLINGVKDALAGAIRAVRAAMHDIIAGAKDAMGMHSPSRVFAEMGQNAVDSFADRVNANAGTATSAVARMLTFGGGRTGGTGPGGSGVGSGAGAAGYAPIIIHLGGQQMAAVHAALIPAAQQYKVRNGATGLA